MTFSLKIEVFVQKEGNIKNALTDSEKFQTRIQRAALDIQESHFIARNMTEEGSVLVQQQKFYHSYAVNSMSGNREGNCSCII